MFQSVPVNFLWIGRGSGNGVKTEIGLNSSTEKTNKNGNCLKDQQLDLNLSTKVCCVIWKMKDLKDDEVLEWFPDEIGAVLPRVDGNAPGPEEPESEDDSPDDSNADADFEGLE
ncbi:hypothetical protein ACOMHN_000760 [Nucella lapillus]